MTKQELAEKVASDTGLSGSDASVEATPSADLALANALKHQRRAMYP